MRRSSSTSGSRRGPARTLVTFFGIMAAVVIGANLLLLHAYQRYRYAKPTGEYAQKLENARAAISAGREIVTLFTGDSTVSVGIMPRVLGSDALNVAWSGFEPSELGVLEQRIREFPSAPRVVVLGVNPTFLSQNEWRNTLDVPARDVLREALESFYSDTNSFKPLVLMGGLSALSSRYLAPPFGGEAEGREDASTTTGVEADGLLVVHAEKVVSAERRDDIKLVYRASNFRMIEEFRTRMARQGVRVVWLYMPYSPGFERALRHGPAASRFFVHYREEIDRIFGRDVIDLSGSVPDELFRDEVHLTRAGAMYLTERLQQMVASGAVTAPRVLPASGSATH